MKKKNMAVQVGLIIFFIIICALIIFPFLLLVSVSLSDAQTVATGYKLIPNPVDFSAYKYVFENPGSILRAYGVTFVVSVAYMVLSVAFMAMVAYPLSRSKLKGRGVLNFYLYFTMLFSGGLVPSYLLNAGVFHLNNTLWIYILPGLISPWYVFMMRTFFQGIPGEIIESATIDGASEYTIFVKMILPLSKPVLATVALFMFLAKWNDWNTALIYIDDANLYSLQYLLQKLMTDLDLMKQLQEMGANMSGAATDVPGETMRMAMAVVAAGPALIVFPFFQKYFVKGLTVGSVKG